MQLWFVTVVPKYLNFATFLKNLLAISILCFCPAFWWRDINIYIVFSVFYFLIDPFISLCVFIYGIYVFA